jgi:hypothetical protein
MTVWNKTGSTTWTKINSIFNKTGSSSWTEIVSVWIKTASNAWTKVFAKVAVPANTVPPAISGSSKLYGTLSGTLGTWTAPNGTNSYARQWQSASNSNGVEGIFGTSQTSGQTSSTYTTTDAVDGRWVRLRVTATNLSGDSTAFSDSVLITKYKPVALAIPLISGAPAVNSTLTALTTVGTYWKNTTTNAGDTSPTTFSYRWYWGDTGDNIGSDSSTYFVSPTDIDHTIRVDVTAKNTGGETTSTSDQTATVGQQIGISNITFKDSDGANGFNNRGNLVTATATRLSWKVSGVNTSTTFRVRYRVLNNQTSAYWNPDTQAVAAASAAWIVYSDDYYGTGNISNVTISGGDAFLYDDYSIPEIFDGSTFSGGIARWTWEYELSAVIGGVRYYWVPGDTVSTSFSFDWWDIDPTSLGTITATPTSGGPGTTVTFSGIIQSYPSGLNTYPYAYRVVYGDGSDSGYQYPSYGTSKPTYSLSHTYNSIGYYSPYVETIPNYSTGTAQVTIQNTLTAPTISSVSSTTEGSPVTAYFYGGSGPYYQIYWTTGVAPTGAPISPDASGGSSPITDTTGPAATGYTWYMYVRSVASVGETSVGPSLLASSWSAGYPFTVTSTAVSQISAPTVRATNTYSSSIVKYLDSITWSAGTYNNASTITSVLLYSTNSANLVAGQAGNTLSSYRTANPYTIVPSDPAGTPYIFAVRDTVLGTNGTTSYYYSSQITSANADAIAFSYGTATSSAGGWTASINSGSQSGASYSLSSGTGTVNSSTGSVTVTGLGSNTTTSVTVNKSVSGYNDTTAPASGTSATVVTYSLNYSANGGSSTPLPQTGASGNTITLATSAGTRSGFTFGGWNISGTTYSAGGAYTFGSADATATAIWNVVFVAPSSGAPSWSSGSNFSRKTTATTHLQWFTDYPSISGSGSFTGMQFEIRTTAGGGTLLASGSRGYPGAGSYPYSAGGTIWAFRCGTTDGDITYNAASRFARARTVMQGTNGSTYFGTWSGWI